MVRISQSTLPFYNRSNYINLHYNRTLFSPLWYRNILSFIHTICFDLFPIRPQECVKDDINEDEFVSSPLLHETFVVATHHHHHQNKGSEQNLTDPEERRRVEQNYYQGHASRNPEGEESEDDIITTTDHTVLVQVDKCKNYGTLSSQILSNERLNYMWKNIGMIFFKVISNNY